MTPDDIREALRKRLFGNKVVQNNFRGELVEEIIAAAIRPSWTHCSEDWSSWDFRRGRQLVQVKQAAARQSWDKDGETQPKRRPAFAVAPNSGYYIGSKWEPLKGKPERLAQIYIFAWHNDATASADHFDFSRWVFFVVPSDTLNKLDGTKPRGSISVAELEIAVGHGSAKKVHLNELLDTLNLLSLACPDATIQLRD